ncbi:MAG: YesL family protein [Lachnospiraceae bacterium]|nr:YesL family protein [Lachnospiraceae bacterium]
MKFFSVDSPLYRFLVRFLDVLKLNFMWLLFSIPVITIGASTVAAMSVALKMTDDEEGYIGRSFIKAFKENWKQGTLLGIITAVAAYAVYLDFQLFNAVEGNPFMFLVIGIVSCFVIVLSLLYAYPLIARYENTLIKTIQNSFEISRRYFGRTLLLVIIVLFEVFIFQFNSTMLFFGILIGPAFIIFTVAAFSKRIFQQIEKEPGSVIEKSSDEDEKEEE